MAVAVCGHCIRQDNPAGSTLAAQAAVLCIGATPTKLAAVACVACEDCASFALSAARCFCRTDKGWIYTSNMYPLVVVGCRLRMLMNLETGVEVLQVGVGKHSTRTGAQSHLQHCPGSLHSFEPIAPLPQGTNPVSAILVAFSCNPSSANPTLAITKAQSTTVAVIAISSLPIDQRGRG